MSDIFNGTVQYKDKEIPILGKVALMNDADAIALHGLIPSIQLPLMAALMSKDSIWFSRTLSTEATSTKDRLESRDIELERARQITLHDYDLEKIETVEGGSTELVDQQVNQYVIRKTQGPKVKAFLPKDRF